MVRRVQSSGPCRISLPVIPKAVPSKSKAVVCFAGPRDHYEGAAALAEAGQLEQLVTDAYFSDCRWAEYAPALVGRFIGFRRHNLIPGESVTTSLKASAYELFGRMTLKHRQYMYGAKDSAIGTLAAKTAEQTDAHLLAYSYYAGAAFNAGRDLRSRLLFQVHPPVLPLRRLYQEEIEREPAARASLSAEMEILPLDAHAEAEQAAGLGSSHLLPGISPFLAKIPAGGCSTWRDLLLGDQPHGREQLVGASGRPEVAWA